LPSLYGISGKHGKDGKDAAEESAPAKVMRDLRDRTRLAELLMGRGHAPEALGELDRIDLSGARELKASVEADPGARWLRGRALEDAGRREEGEPLMSDPSQVLASYGPWWATRARWARLRGDEGVAVPSFDEAVAADPFDAEGACETLDPVAVPPQVASDATKDALCTSARARPEPPFDDD